MRKIASLFAMLMLFSALAFGQARTITGTVINEKGEVVPGVSVNVKGSSGGTAADNKGQFSINAKTGDKLVITGVNIEPLTVTVGEGNTVAVSVKTSMITTTEVVVTALGIRRSEKSLGYAVSKVDPNTLLQKSEPDLLKGLQGKVPGVDIRTSQGTPGAATRIQIRGNSSLGLETQPLIVVDGVPYSNDQVSTSSQTSGGTAYGSGIANIDANDIESMSVLKGSAATSLYGARGSRGVVVITTKSGSAKKGAKPLNVNFRSSYSSEKIASLPEYQNSYGTGAQLRYSNSNGSWGPRFGLGNVYDGGGNIIRASASGVDSLPAWPEFLAAYPELFDANKNMAYVAKPNNVKDLFRSGSVYENSIGINGGDANSSFALTASNLIHNGYVENSSYVKNNVGLGAQTKYKNLTVSGNFSFARSKQLGGYFGENQVGGATSQFARTMFLGRNWDLNLPYQDALGKPLIPNGGAQFDNPRWAAINNVATTIEERIIAGVRLGYKINNWVSVSYNFGLNTASLGRDEVTQEFSRAANGLGRIIVDNYKSQELNSTLVATFSPKIGGDFSLEAHLGNDINQRTSRRQTNTGLDFIVPKIYNLVNTATQSFNNDSKFRRRIVGFFADATLGYKTGHL
ncbi:MAG: TonB-dependent receptor plug domain-containing protein [Chitinophagaceae bacterium]|nr:TonB-dependent receptor plug domain-containing protein [Chitinophagaceae bacterium]